MYHYWGFGLNISSVVEFPELLPHSFNESDISITIGEVMLPQTKPYYANDELKYYLADCEFYFEVRNTAKYYAANGNTIVMAPFAGAVHARSIRLFVLATVMSAILLQRKLVPLHASAILNNGSLTLIGGNSGAGKSTTLAGLMKRNHRLFSDDIVVMNPLFFANASYPMIKLWGDTLDKLDSYFFADMSFSIRPGLNKYGLFFKDDFDINSYPVKKIIILKKADVPGIEIKELTGAEAFNEVSKQIYRPKMLHNNTLRALAFTMASHLAKNSVIYQVTRPVDCHPDSLLDFVEPLVR